MKKDDITAILVGLGLASHIFGYFFWRYVKVVNIYYVSFYFMMLNVGFCFMLVMRGEIWKWVSVGMFAFSSGFLYMEFAGDPSEWTMINLATFVFICSNSFLISHHIEKYKKKHNG